MSVQDSTAAVASDYPWKHPDPLYDQLLGTGLVLCLLFGLPGNILSLSYFLSKKRLDLATCLYLAICSVDICTCLVHLPVSIALFNGRRPGLFGHHPFCVGWAIVFTFAQQISIFLVLLLSVTRTMHIVRPFLPITKRAVAITLLGFVAFRVAHEACLNSVPNYVGMIYYYSPPTAYCFYNVDHPWSTIDEIISSFFIAVVPIGITISFIVSVRNIFPLKQPESRPDAHEKKRVTVTMTLFTSISLLCSTPLLVNYSVYIVDCIAIIYRYPGSMYKNLFMYSYSWPITEIFFMALNSALNPLIYFCRMERLRAWVVRRFVRGTEWLGNIVVSGTPLHSVNL